MTYTHRCENFQFFKHQLSIFFNFSVWEGNSENLRSAKLRFWRADLERHGSQLPTNPLHNEDFQKFLTNFSILTATIIHTRVKLALKLWFSEDTTISNVTTENNRDHNLIFTGFSWELKMKKVSPRPTHQIKSAIQSIYIHPFRLITQHNEPYLDEPCLQNIHFAKLQISPLGILRV